MTAAGMFRPVTAQAARVGLDELTVLERALASWVSSAELGPVKRTTTLCEINHFHVLKAVVLWSMT